MRLRRHTDYASRVVIDVTGRRGRRCSAPEIAAAQKVSGRHLVKIAAIIDPSDQP